MACDLILDLLLRYLLVFTMVHTCTCSTMVCRSGNVVSHIYMQITCSTVVVMLLYSTAVAPEFKKNEK
jgi:hypothetical protein